MINSKHGGGIRHMKKLGRSFKRVLSLTFLSFLLTASIFVSLAAADTVTTVATVQAQLGTLFFMGFSPDGLYSTNLPFGTIDSSKSQCRPFGSEGSGKPDTALVCVTNLGQTWYLKLKGEAGSSPAFPMQDFQYYMSLPQNRNGGNHPADGILARPENWYSIPASSTTVYTAGPTDLINTTLGTMATFSFAINPQRLTGSTTYIITITYTLTTSP